MNATPYMPILKAKAGELEALLVTDEPLLADLKLKTPEIELFLDNNFWDSNKLLQNQVHPLEYLCRSVVAKPSNRGKVI